MTPREIVIATRNRGKAAELRALLAPLGSRVLDLADVGVPYESDEDGVEVGSSFEENALAKARYFAARCQERAVLADDSGLCVTGLGGAPGVYSRRYSGVVGDDQTVAQANNARLLSALAGVADRRAVFVAALAYVSENVAVVTTGATPGRILAEGRGLGGFGYDPLFWSDELGRSFAEASADEKARVSHRARAAVAMLDRLGVGRATPGPQVDGPGSASYTHVESGA